MERSMRCGATAVCLALAAGMAPAGEQAEALTEAVEQAGLEFGVLLEAEAYAGRDGGEDVGDIVMATVELAAEAAPVEWARGALVLLWEEDEADALEVDEAFITLGGTEAYPLFAKVGRMYVPFGAFESRCVSDPLVLELGETRETAVSIGYAAGCVACELAVFNGDIDAEGDDDRIDECMAALTLTPAAWLTCGAYWISDLGEADGLQDGLRDAAAGGEDSAPIPYAAVDGAGAFITLQAGAFTLIGEYLGALDAFAEGLLAETALKPRAWNMELAWAATDSVELALRGEGADAFPDVPETQYGGCVTVALAEGLSVAVEHLHGEYDTDMKDRDITTAQLALEF
jgi:hypothetical protein